MSLPLDRERKMSILYIIILTISLEVKHAERNNIDVLWKNIEIFNGHVFSHNVSFITTEISRTTCAMSCWGVPLCISFTYDGNACKGYSEMIKNSIDSIASLEAFYYAVEHGYVDCSDVKHRNSGVYRIFPTGMDEGLKVYCDMDTDGGGWTVIQKRQDGSVDFYRTWYNYSYGFGDLSGEFYLGNKYINILTNQAQYELRVDVTNAFGESRYALYSSFSVGPGSSNYTLHVSGYDANSNAGDSLTSEDQNSFQTKDYARTFCPTERKGAWWYGTCSFANLNGIYSTPGEYNVGGVRWDTFEMDISMKYADMKIRRKN